MLSLLKKDLFITKRSEFIFYFLIIAILLLIRIPAATFFAVALISTIWNSFHIDYEQSTRLYMLSLPVKRSTIVASRYVSSLLFAVFVLAYQSLLMMMVYMFNKNHVYVYTPFDLFMLVLVTLLITAIVTPFFYTTKSSSVAIYMFLIFATIGGGLLHLFIEERNDYKAGMVIQLFDLLKEEFSIAQWSLITVFVIGLFIVSYVISLGIVHRKE